MTPRTLAPLFALSGLASLCSAEQVDFSHDVLPILETNCAKCHSDGTYKGKLSIDTREALIESGSVTPGRSAGSEFIARLTHEDPDERMPQKADALKPDEIAALTKWVDQGLKWEPGFTFKKSTWKAPLKPRRPQLPGPDGKSPIDQIVGAYFAKHKIKAPAMADDVTFLRRIHLDLIGTLPTPQEIEAFATSGDPDKRAEVASKLLARDADYAAHWMSFWNDLLRNDYAGTGFIDGGRRQITGWLYEALRTNRPYDQFVRELIDPSDASQGFIKGIKWRGQVNASQVPEVQFAQNISQVFLGENMKCASCHDSFINDWKLTDAYGLAAIIAAKPLELHRCDKPTGVIAKPKFIFPELGEISGSTPKERLRQTAALMTAPENGRLGRTVANRLWQRLMGRGLIEPVDIMANEPWSPDLIDHLGVHLSDSGYDLKKLLLAITTSDAYAARCVPPHQGPPSDFRFRGPVAKRLTAEQFIDAVWRITATAPAKADVKLPAVSVPLSEGPGTKVQPTWIWSHKNFSTAAGGETALFRRQIELESVPENAAAIITCDNEYRLTVNGTPAGTDANWESVEIVRLNHLLKTGTNTIEVEGRNGTSAPNPAGLLIILRLGDRFVSGDSTWQARSKDSAKWDRAALIKTPIWGNSVTDQVRRLGGSSAPASTPAVRASLVKSNLLMRALGRPNREQVVTTRPAELSTLQALELNNGKEFVALLEAGARNRPDLTPAQIYREALGRNPTAREQQIANQILKTQGVADLLWITFMLPEFQIVR